MEAPVLALASCAHNLTLAQIKRTVPCLVDLCQSLYIKAGLINYSKAFLLPSKTSKQLTYTMVAYLSLQMPQLSESIYI